MVATAIVRPAASGSMSGASTGADARSSISRAKARWRASIADARLALSLERTKPITPRTSEAAAMSAPTIARISLVFSNTGTDHPAGLDAL